jgi:hypothetical protein
MRTGFALDLTTVRCEVLDLADGAELAREPVAG